jgi:DNA primase
LSIPRETIDLIRDRAQIEDIIKRYVPSMKKRGANYIGLCPFHKEKTPSFTVSPEKQIFHCFGCQAGGNIYSFISKIEGLNFPESVKFVGNLVGIRVDEDKKDENTGEYKKLKDINNTAAELFHNTIKTEQGKKGLNYLLKRGVTKESIIEFKLGYSPDSWDFLTSYLNNKKIPLNLASETGLLSISDKGGDKKRYYDRFRDRVIFPIFNRRNEIAAFGGRILENGEPKYLNSPESRIYQKRRELYGFNIAKEHISSLGRAIIVEGYLDVIGCHQAGVKNVVAPLGTALTSEQVRTLSRLCSEIVLLFDADSAGINAALRSIDVVKDININMKIAVLPDGDPFDFIPRKGIREFMIVVDQALSPVDFQITRIIKSTGNRDRLNVLIEIFRVINGVEFDTEKDKAFKKVSVLLNVDEASLRADYTRFLTKNQKDGPGIQTGDPKTSKKDFLTRSYEEIILLICKYPELITQASMDFGIDEFPDDITRNIFKKLSDFSAENDGLSSEKIVDLFPEGEERQFLEKNLFQEIISDNPVSAASDYTKRYLRIKIEHIDRKIENYSEIINKKTTEPHLNINHYIAEIEVLRREKEKISSFL